MAKPLITIPIVSTFCSDPCAVRDVSCHFIEVHKDLVLVVYWIRSFMLTFDQLRKNLLFLYFPFNGDMGVPLTAWGSPKLRGPRIDVRVCNSPDCL